MKNLEAKKLRSEHWTWKKWKEKQAGLLAMLGMALVLTGCGNAAESGAVAGSPKQFEGVTEIILSDQEITVDGEVISEDQTAAVYAAGDIIFYLEGQGFTYGEGGEADEHSQEEADAHTVVHITEPGTYAVSGSLSAGQIAVDLGEEAEEDPEAVVTLILNQMDITCTVAPGVIFYNVYECGTADPETAGKDVDTSAAGANVLIADGTHNTVNGSYVARIYKSYELSADGKSVVDSKKLHKYDGAFYSKMSMNIYGDEEGTGILEINAENEGLDSELHLTLNGGNIRINSGNDGINTNEDEVSVTTVNGGTLEIVVNGSTGEGDGIDSNGWLVINGGTVSAFACGFSADSGIDSDMGIHINGGTVITTGNMLDQITESSVNYSVFSFAGTQSADMEVVLKNARGKKVGSWKPANDYSCLILAGDWMEEDTYTLWIDGKQYAGSKSENGMGFGFMGGGMPQMPGGFGGGEMPEMPEGFGGGEMPEMPEGFGGGEMPEMPGGFGNGERPEMPEGFGGGEIPARPDGTAQNGGFGSIDLKSQGGWNGNMQQELDKKFEITAGGNYFNFVSVAD